MVWKAGNPAWEGPQNVALSEIGDVSYFEFLLPVVGGVPLRQQHLYAQFVVEGYWVDLHISKPLYEPREHELFERLVKSARFEPKERAGRGRAPEEAARQAAEAWLPLLDSGKYAESYGPVSVKIKGRLSQRQWGVGMTQFRRPLGKLKSRGPGEVTYIKSLPGYPGYEGASVRFESVFENGPPLVETVGVIRDDDGEWRVLLYVIPDGAAP